LWVCDLPVGAAAGCDLLTLLLTIKIKRSQPAAAPTVFSSDISLHIGGGTPSNEEGT
jgi:hypothetical protein